MDPLSQFLSQLLGQPIGPGSIVPNISTGGGIPGTSSIGSALPGLNFSPYAASGSPYAPGGSGTNPGIGSPVGTATPGGVGSSGLGASPFLEGSIFNSFFPSSVNQATNTQGGAAQNTSMAPAASGTGQLLNMAAPTSGETNTSGGGQGDIGTAAPGESGQAGPAASSAISSQSFGLPGNIFSGAQQGLIGFGLNSLGANPTFSMANGNPSFSMNSGVPGPTASLAGLISTLGNLFGGPLFGLANMGLGGLAGGLQGSPTRSGDFSGPLGSFFGNGTNNGNVNFAGFNNSLSDQGRSLPDVNFSGRGVEGEAPGDTSGDTSGDGTAAGAAGSAAGVAAGAAPGGAPGPGASAAGVAGDAAAAAASGEGGGGGGGGGGSSLLCHYCLGNGSYDEKTSTNHRKVFGALAGRAIKDPAIKESFGHYQQASRQILDKIDTLDQPRRKAQLADLHETLVKPFHALAKAGDVKGAGRILRDQTVKLAKAHGVTIPPAHLEAANKALGGAEDGTTGA